MGNQHAASAAHSDTSLLADMVESSQDAILGKRTEEQLRESQLMETIGQLAGGMAHDFINLLTAIMSYATLAASETHDLAAVRADLHEIQSTARRAGALTRQLLTFSQRAPGQPRALDLNTAITGLRDLLTASIGARARLSIDPGAALPAIYIDRSHAEQVLLNLAVNARDAMPHGGTLTIATSLAELDGQHARTHPGTKPGRYVELTVSDTGTGMSADTMTRIFEPFYTTRPLGHGTGLGLSTVQGIVTGAGGGISVESEEGTGTTFHLYLPAVSASAQVPPPRTGIEGSGKAILVVDDEPAVLAAVSRMLLINGYTTLEASTCDQALSIMTSRGIDLLLTDAIMPGVSGASLADRVADLKPGLPIVYMSGSTEGLLSHQGHHELAFLQKPFTVQDLLEKVGAALTPGRLGPVPYESGTVHKPQVTSEA
jgi:two-component system cell cycle sensor histidine kinase/response regulator CckA